MYENRFVAVGRIERLISGSHGLTLVIGGAGPVKALVAVELRDGALIKLVTSGPTGFAAGDVVSISGRLEFDVDTLRNVAVASPDGVSRISRGAPGSTDQARRGPMLAMAQPEPAPATVAGLFGVSNDHPSKRPAGAGAHIPAIPNGFLATTPLDAEPVGLNDIPL